MMVSLKDKTRDVSKRVSNQNHQARLLSFRFVNIWYTELCSKYMFCDFFIYILNNCIFFTYVDPKELGKKHFHFFRRIFRGKIQDGCHRSPKVLQSLYLWQ